MKVEQLHIDQIKAAFETMHSKEDFLNLLNIAKPLVYGKNAIPFQIKQLTWYSNPKLSTKRYTQFNIKKKSGGERIINSPISGLKALQRTIAFVLQCVFVPHKSAMGFIKERSIVDNARLHEGRFFVYNIDLKDFFSSIDQARVWKCLQLRPFNLKNNFLPETNSKKELNRERLASMIAAICCTEMDVERKTVSGEWESVKGRVLPQGAPTSPVITNIVCQRLDYVLSAVAKRFGLIYSRYADDITFSSLHNVYQENSEFLNELNRVISEQGFHIKESKTRLQKEGYRKEVTGLVVNEKANVQNRYIKQLRMWLYYWERYGYVRASGFFLQEYLADKSHVKKGRPEMESVISGKLDYLKMVKGSDNELYLKLKSRFDKRIANSTKSNDIPEEEITTEIDNNQVKITLEVYRSPKMNEKLNNSIKIPKDTILPSTIIVLNSIEKIEEVEEDSKQNKLFPHNPMYTISFLKKFKIGDGSGFKELVHDIILSDETIQEILNKVKCHPNFIYHFKKEWISDVSFLNRAIQKEVIKLIDLFEMEGLPFYKNSHRHPFNNDSKYTNYAKQFKKKYRYGSGSEYSKLQSDIINIFNDQRVPINSLSFMPDERKFNIRSSFFTWQPAIHNGIRYIVQGIRDHSNTNGVGQFNPMTKKIIVEVERKEVETLSFVQLTIFDSKSRSKIDSLTLLQFFQGSSPFKFDFRNLCDWIVECDFLDESSKRINLLNAPEYSQLFQEIEELPYNVGGFKHILRFYDVR